MKLKPEWKYAAMDEDGEWYFYEEKPKKLFNEWFNDRGTQYIDTCIFIFPEVEDWTKSLHTITEGGELVPYVDIPADGEKVMVVGYSGEWCRRYSAGRLDADGYLLCYANGSDKWSSDDHPLSWKEWRRPTEEELL